MFNHVCIWHLWKKKLAQQRFTQHIFIGKQSCGYPPQFYRHPEKTSLHRINNLFWGSPQTQFRSQRSRVQGTCDDQAVPVRLSAAITTSGHWFPIIAALGPSWRPWRHGSGSWALGTLGLVTSCSRQILRQDKFCTPIIPPAIQFCNKLWAEVDLY